MRENTFLPVFTAYRVEVEVSDALKTTTKTCDGQQYLDCLVGVLTVVTDDPTMIMQTFRVIKLEKLGPGYVLERERE